MLSLSIDGISSVGPRVAGPLTELFPSFDSIAEIRVSEINNTAEFGGVSDITTISKSGTNSFHGAAFEFFRDHVLDAPSPFDPDIVGSSLGSITTLATQAQCRPRHGGAHGPSCT